MNKRLYWGVGLLIFLLIAGGAFLFYSQHQELQQLKQESAEADKRLEDSNKPIAREGFKMVPHDDHFHEVPIDAPDTWQEQPMPVVANDTPNNVQQPDIILSAETQRDWRKWNQSYMDEMEGDPLSVDHYNFLKEHPDFNLKTASPELKAKYMQVLLAKQEKINAYSDKITAATKEAEAQLSYERKILGPIGNNAGGDK